MKRSPIKPSSKPMKRNAFLRGDRIHAREVTKIRKSMKVLQRSVTVQEHMFWNRLATEVGCIACLKDGQFNPHVSIHHIDGRTKPGCHKRVLPLCAQHHQQDDSDLAQRVAVHPNKAQFEDCYGAQCALLLECTQLLESRGFECPQS